MACPFHLRSHEENSHILWEKAIRSLAELKRQGCLIVVFEGGEPLLWNDGPHDFPELVAYAKRGFLCVGAITNGTLTLDVPTDALWVSIDGPKHTHDMLRSDSFDIVVRNLKAAKHRKLFVHFTFNHQNWQDFEATIHILSSIPQVKGITVQFFYLYDQGEAPLAMDTTGRALAIEKVLELKQKGLSILNSRAGLKAMIENTWQCHEWLLAHVDPRGSVTTGCYAQGRGDVKCTHSGFIPVAEASGAFELRPGSLLADWRIFPA
jgi:MoaA/NifB/PqqE/SkfB family radical SAM enzyme